MKKSLLIFSLIIVSAFGYSQSPITLSLQQDARLLLVGDQSGNDPLTANLMAKVEIPIFKFKKNHLAIYPSAEYADLIGGKFERYALGIAYSVKSLYGKIGAVAFLDLGNIYRQSQEFSSFSLSGELNFKLNNSIQFICTQQLTQRKDLKALYDSQNEYVISGFIGLKFSL
jgi:hypothetical protein